MATPVLLPLHRAAEERKSGGAEIRDSRGTNEIGNGTNVGRGCVPEGVQRQVPPSPAPPRWGVDEGIRTPGIGLEPALMRERRDQMGHRDDEDGKC